jgi:uncharacterized protein YjbJ (UPF0337 family)
MRVPIAGTGITARGIFERKEQAMTKFDEAKGRAERAAGELTGDKDMKRKGTVDKAAGKAKEAIDDASGAVKDRIDGDRR